MTDEKVVALLDGTCMFYSSSSAAFVSVNDGEGAGEHRGSLQAAAT